MTGYFAGYYEKGFWETYGMANTLESLSVCATSFLHAEQAKSKLNAKPMQRIRLMIFIEISSKNLFLYF